MKIKIFFGIMVSAVCMLMTSVLSVSVSARTYLPRIDNLTDIQLECADTIVQGMKDYEDEIDISQYRLDINQVQQVFFYVSLTDLDLFHVNMSVYSYNDAPSGIITSVSPGYLIDEDDYDSAERELESAVNAIVSGVDEDWSVIEKALYVHDYIASHCTYAYDDDYDGKTIYNALVEGEAVCVGYSFAYKYIMDRLGVDCICVCNDEHMWNMIEYDGNWYHVDVTWDDPSPDYENQANHNFFMISDSAILNSDALHKQWSYGETADDETYDNSFWSTSLTAFVYDDSTKLWYGGNEYGIISYSFETGDYILLYKFDKYWNANDKYYITIPVSCLVLHGGTIYFNSPDSVYAYDISENSIKKIATASRCTSGVYQIYELYIDGNKLMCGYCRDYTMGNTNAAEVLTFSDIAPNPPENLTAARIGDYVELEWNKSDNAVQYAVYRLDKENNRAIRITVTTDTSCTLISSADYYYAVKAVSVNDGKYLYSDFSQWVMPE